MSTDRGLFDPEGPAQFGQAVGSIASNLDEVVTAFGRLQTKADQSLAAIEERLQKIQTITKGFGGAGGGGGGNWGLKTTTSGGGPMQAPQGNTMGVGGTGNTPPRPGQVQFPGMTPATMGQPQIQPMAGMAPAAGTPPTVPWINAPDGGVQTAAPGSPDPWSAHQQQQAPNGGQQGAGGAGAAGGAATRQPPASMLQRSAISLAPQVAGMAARNLTGGMDVVAAETQQANFFTSFQPGGWSMGAQRRLSTVPRNQYATSGQDWVNSQYAMQQMGVNPYGGSRNATQLQGAANMQQMLNPNLDRTAAMGSINAFMNPQAQRAFLQLGMKPAQWGGQQQSLQAIYQSIVDRAVSGGFTTLMKMNGDQLAQELSPQGPMYQHFSILTQGQGDWQAFITWVSKTVSARQTGKQAPDLTTAAGQKDVGLQQTPAATKRASTSAEIARQSQLTPTMADAAMTLNKASQNLNTAADNLLRAINGKGGSLSSGIGGLVAPGASAITRGGAGGILGLGSHAGKAALAFGSFGISIPFAGLAAGGNAPAGSARIVGEQGPELLIQGSTSGQVVPNDQLNPKGFNAGGVGYGTTGAGSFSGAPAKMQEVYQTTGGRQLFFNDIFKQAGQAAASAASTAAGATGTSASTGTTTGVTASGGTTAQNKVLAQQMAQARGWGGQWDPLDKLIMSESGYNQLATNPSSGAYGIAQALPASKYPMAGQKAGGSDPKVQLQWMYDYISQRYGDPAKAWQFHLSHNWYARGSQNIDQTQLAMLHKGERVVPAAENYSVAGRYTREPQSGGGTQVHFNGNIIIQGSGTSKTDAKSFMSEVKKQMSTDDTLAALGAK